MENKGVDNFLLKMGFQGPLCTIYFQTWIGHLMYLIEFSLIDVILLIFH